MSGVWRYCCACVFVFRCLYFINWQNEGRQRPMDGGSMLCMFCALALKMARSKLKFNVIADKMHSHNRNFNLKFSLWFGCRLSEFQYMSLRKSNKYNCNTLFTSTIRRIFFFSFWWHVRAVIGSSIQFQNHSLCQWSIHLFLKNQSQLFEVVSLFFFTIQRLFFFWKYRNGI